MTERERLLLDAAAATRDRGESYGDPQTHFARTVGAINAVFAHKLREPLTPADWGLIMVLDKCAREQHAPKRDNMTDIAGYAACVAEIRDESEAFSQSWAGRVTESLGKRDGILATAEVCNAIKVAMGEAKK